VLSGRRLNMDTVVQGCRNARLAVRVCDQLDAIMPMSGGVSSPLGPLELELELADLELLVDDPDMRPYIWDLEE